MRKFGKALNVMSEEDKQAVRTHCGALMDLFGYQVSELASVRSIKHGFCLVATAR